RLSPFSDDVLLRQNVGQLLAGRLVGALQHHAGALLGRGEALEDVGGRALQADGGGVDQGIVLQRLIVVGGHGLAVSLEHTAHAHIAGLVQLLDAGDQAGSLDLDGHVAVLQHPLDGDGVAVLLDVGGVGHLGQMQLLGNLGTHLGSVAIDGLPAAHDDVVSLYADLVDGRSQDLRGGVCIGTAELAGGHQHGLVSAHSQRLAEHTGSGRRTHGHHNNLAAGGVLDLQG
ncbi:Septum formation inhibitor-activating ATPase, partial [Dysosmobacter welbionis]